MDLNECASLIQNYLSNNPLVILGSGASATFGLPTMADLSNELMRYSSQFDDESSKAFFSMLKCGESLESAMGSVNQLNDSDSALIRKIIWEFINSKDLSFFESIIKNDFQDFTLVRLIEKIISASPYKVDIITTNYDRLAEYASDKVGASVISGFEGLYYRKMEISSRSMNVQRIKARERQVSVWKVHGSLDWFISPQGEYCDLPNRCIIPDGFLPCIVPPGKNKYLETHQNPYRDIIANADVAIENAKCFLIVGYGFNDDHIQPKIIEKIKNKKSVVILAKQATESCKKVIQDSGAKDFLIIEEDQSKKYKTHVISSGGDYYFDDEFWSIDGFMKIW